MTPTAMPELTNTLTSLSHMQVSTKDEEEKLRKMQEQHGVTGDQPVPQKR